MIAPASPAYVSTLLGQKYKSKCVNKDMQSAISAWASALFNIPQRDTFACMLSVSLEFPWFQFVDLIPSQTILKLDRVSPIDYRPSTN